MKSLRSIKVVLYKERMKVIPQAPKFLSDFDVNINWLKNPNVESIFKGEEWLNDTRTMFFVPTDCLILPPNQNIGPLMRPLELLRPYGFKHLLASFN